ncbi:MAG: flagellar basal body P-ring formation protein FlgA [Alphaproteobacteria bacterium]|nr:flagellar basal body P-ring formation protein FlgA [Alphaproteobacteria bacterium]
MLRITFAALLALTLPATAQVTGAIGPASPMLRRAVTVESDVVRIGDLIDNAGAAANIPIFRAPDLGDTGPVPAKRVIDAARSHDLFDIDADGILDVMVTHASRAITSKQIEARIAQAIAAQYGLTGAGDLAVMFDREVRTMHVETTATAELQVVRLSYDSRSGHFDAALELPGSAAAQRLRLRFAGNIAETVETVVLARPLARGEILRAADVVMERRPKTEAGNDTFNAADAAIGLSVRRAMRPGQMLRQADLTKPELVQRNEAVTLLFEVPGILLTVRGKALDAGTQGDIINVLNTQSKRTVQGTVTALGTVTVTSMKPRIAANIPSAEMSDLAINPRTE